MDMAVTAVLLFIAASVYSLKPPHQCRNITRQDALLMRKQRCNITGEEGHLNALCKILIVSPYFTYPEDKPGYLEVIDAVAMEVQLVSDKPVVNMTPQDGPACLSLQRIWVKKWDDYRGNVNVSDYITVVYDEYGLGPFSYDSLYDILRMSFNTTFHRPPQVAAAICKERKADRSCVFDIYGFLHSTYNSTIEQEFDISIFEQNFVVFSKDWNIGFSWTETLNITLLEYTPQICVDLGALAHAAPLRKLIIHECKFGCSEISRIPAMKRVEDIAFIKVPIRRVEAYAFEEIPHVRRISLVGTELSGIPRAIFSLRYLETLDMRSTRAPTDVQFDYCPTERSANSTVTRLTLSGSKLKALPNRAFCAFPVLEELTLDKCNLLDFSESPFECSEHLKVLSISGNRIRSLYGKHVKGLESLVYLNLSNNNVAYFQGSIILSRLPSLRTLALSYNKLRKLELYSPANVKIEELHLEGNYVHIWEPPLFTLMPELKKLSIAHNEVKQIDYEMLCDIQRVNNLDVSRNPWDCFSCDLKNLHTLLYKHPAGWNDSYLCEQPLEQYRVDVRDVAWRKDDCTPPDYYRVYGVPALMSFLVTIILVNFVYSKRWFFIYGFLYLKVTIKRHRRQKDVGRFLWDAFLSYHASDADWVRNVLLPRLESPPMQFRLCVAERDFIPGIEITENVYRAISQSRLSLFVLSREFCRSRWCLFELSLAQHRLFESNRQDSIVFMKKDDVGESEMSSMLQYLTKSRTYVQLPPEGARETLYNLFWLQLQAALEQ